MLANTKEHPMSKNALNTIDILEGCYALCCCIGFFYFQIEFSTYLRLLLVVFSIIGILVTIRNKRKLSIGSGLAAIWNIYFVIGFF